MKKMSSVAFFLKNSSCPIHPVRRHTTSLQRYTYDVTRRHIDVETTSYQKLTPLQVFRLFVPRILKIAKKAPMVESLFSKVTETSAFCNSVEKSNICMVSSKK